MKRCKHEEEIILLAYDELAEAEKNRALAHIEFCNHCKNAFSEYKLCAEAFQSLPEVPVFHPDPSRLREAILSRELRMATRWNLARAFAFSASVVAAISLALVLPSYLSRTSSNEYAANLSSDVDKLPDERIADSEYARSPATASAPFEEEKFPEPMRSKPSVSSVSGGVNVLKPERKSKIKKPVLVATSVPRMTERSENSTLGEVSEVVLAASLGAGSSTAESVTGEENTSAPVVIIQPGKAGFAAGAVEVKSPDDVSIGG